MRWAVAAAPQGGIVGDIVEDQRGGMDDLGHGDQGRHGGRITPEGA
ncbi:hypothetical protein LP420_39325 [Massilia sp. B-10]|nr:hypothetical protein LP420_39325 [Massilia sp. B-10]